MPNVTFVITEPLLLADQDGRQQVIASISDDNAKRIVDLTGLAGEVEALKAHCHRMLNLARNRHLGYCDHNRAVQAIMEECGKMGMDQQPTQTDWHGEGTTPEADRVLLAMISILEHNGTIAPVIARDGREAISRLQCALPKARMHDDAHAMLDTLGIARRSENGAEFTLQHRIGVLNDDAEREKGAAYRDAAAAEQQRDALRAERDHERELANDARAALKTRENRDATLATLEIAHAKLMAERDALKARIEAVIAKCESVPACTPGKFLAVACARIAAGVGMEPADTEIPRHGDVDAKLVQSSVLMPVLAEISRALTKFPTWPTDPLHAMAVLGEEYGELNKAILQEVYEPHKQDRAAVRTEAVQCAAMALRFLTSMDAYRFDRCEQHRQEVKGA